MHGVPRFLGRAVMLLEHGNVYLAWDDSAQEFIMILDGKVVTDLVTSTDSRGWVTFEGGFISTGPKVRGAVDSVVTRSWIVELSKTSQFAKIYHVQSTFAGIIIAMIQACECSDGIGMSCTDTACRNKESCSAENRHLRLHRNRKPLTSRDRPRRCVPQARFSPGLVALLAMSISPLHTRTEVTCSQNSAATPRVAIMFQRSGVHVIRKTSYGPQYSSCVISTCRR
jgi:hypothetical protein